MNKAKQKKYKVRDGKKFRKIALTENFHLIFIVGLHK